MSVDGSKLCIPCDCNNSEEDGLTIPFHPDAQDEHPFHCVECWESEHKSLQKDECLPFDELAGNPGLVEEKAWCLVGCDVEAPPDSKPVPQRLGHGLDQCVASLHANIANDALVDSLLANSPRPCPTAKPVDQEVWWNLATQGGS